MARKPAKNFEEAILALEESVRRLENGEITLEESIKEYKKGMELAAFCNAILTKAEQEIYIYEQGQYHKIEQGE